jgi:aldose 1-epimerase
VWLLGRQTDERRPEWGRVDAQITGPGEIYTWESSWAFGTM